MIDHPKGDASSCTHKSKMLPLLALSVAAQNQVLVSLKPTCRAPEVLVKLKLGFAQQHLEQEGAQHTQIFDL